jgi:ABC-type multidrug transport system fused ATPase/permease subunit
LFVPNSRRNTAIIVALIYVLPFYIIHYTDYQMVYISLRGNIRKLLQANLLRKFLNYREDIRPTLPITEVQMAMVRDVPEVVDMGYMKMLSGIRILGKLAFCCLFILTESKVAWIPLVIMPIVLAIFLYCRERVTMAAVGGNAMKQDDVVRGVTDTVKSYKLIADFAMRPQIVDSYEMKLESLNDKEAEMLTVMTNNTFIAPLLTFVSIGCYIVYAAEAFHLGQATSIGLFVTTINVFKEIGGELQEIYLEFLEVQRTFHPLNKIAFFMNMPTDLSDRRRIAIRRRKEAAEERARRRAQQQAGDEAKQASHSFAVDSIQIRTENLSFSFPSSSLGAGRQILKDVSASFDQGKLYAFVGEPHQGKSTFLRLLGQVYLPADGCGSIFVPPHLRILHVAQTVHIVHGSLMKNLTLGQDEQSCGGIDRVREICRLLGFPDNLMDYLEPHATYRGEDEPDPNKETEWTTVLTDSAKARLTLARAFIMNPEVLVVNKPTMAFNAREKQDIIRALRSHVDERGLALPQDEWRLRRPRTVFFSMSAKAIMSAQASLCDQSFEVSGDGLVDAKVQD